MFCLKNKCLVDIWFMKGLFTVFFLFVILAGLPKEEVFAFDGAFSGNAENYYNKYGADNMKFFSISATDGNIYFCSRGKTSASTSGIKYRTVGWQFHLYNTRTGANGYLYYASHGSKINQVGDSVHSSDGYTYNLYYITLNEGLKERLDSSWENAFIAGEVELEVNACMTTVVNGVLKGTIDDNGNTTGTVYKTYDGISNAANWSSSSKTTLQTYFNKSIDGLFHEITITKGSGISSTSGSGTYLYGTKVPIIATLSTGYQWNANRGSKWTGSDGYSSIIQNSFYTIGKNNVTLTVNASAKQVTVNFYRNCGENDQGVYSETYTYGVSGQKFGMTLQGEYAAWAKWNWSPEGYYYPGDYDHGGGWGKSATADTSAYSLNSQVLDWWIDSNAPSVNLYMVRPPKQVTVNFYRNYGENDQGVYSETYTYGVSGQKFGMTLEGEYAAWAKWNWSPEGYYYPGDYAHGGGWARSSTAETCSFALCNDVLDWWINSNAPSVDLYMVRPPKPANSTAAYKVYHYLMEPDGENYSLWKTDEGTEAGGSILQISDLVLSPKGFRVPEEMGVDEEKVTSTTLKEEDTTEIYLYYERLKYQLKVSPGYGIDDVQINGKSVQKQDIYFGENVTISALVKNGYQWDSSAGWTGTLPSGEQNYSFIMPDEDVDMIASAVLISYDIVYHLDGGTVTGNKEHYTIEDTFILKNPVKEGFEFQGWTGSNGEDPQIVATIEKGTTGTLDFYANWEQQAYYLAVSCFLNGTEEKHLLESLYDTEADRNIGSFDVWIKKTGEDWYQDAVHVTDYSKRLPYGTQWKIQNIVGEIYEDMLYSWDGIRTGEKGEQSWSEDVEQEASIEGTIKEAQWIVPVFTSWYETILDSQGATVPGTEKICHTICKPAYYKEVGTNSALEIIMIPQKFGFAFQGYFTEKNGSGIQYIDSKGNFMNDLYAQNKSQRLYAWWTSEPPEISAFASYFSLEEARKGKITEEKLLTMAEAWDKEEGKLQTGNHSGTIFGVEEFDAYQFLSLEKGAVVPITYVAKDQAANVCKESAYVYVVDTRPQFLTSSGDKIRFISQDYLECEENQGGLMQRSIWKKEDFYKILWNCVKS